MKSRKGLVSTAPEEPGVLFFIQLFATLGFTVVPAGGWAYFDFLIR